VPSAHGGLAVELLRQNADDSVLVASGMLSLDSARSISLVLAKALAETGRVLVDVSGLRIADVTAAQVFPSVLARMGGWPDSRLVLFAADPELTRTLEDLRVTLKVPLAADETAARLLLGRRPPVVARTVDLEHAPESARRARLFVDAACVDWRLEMIKGDAMVVASELVANAVLHAGTASRLALRCRERGLTIAVYDSRPDLLPPLRAVAEGRLGHGLLLVAALSLHWGVRQGRDEKCVWAFLPATASATYSRIVRMAAHEAVRVVLAHGASSRDSRDAVALRQLVARLAEQHGLDFLRDVADELVAELAEASSAIIPQDD
jgi:anti-anti-sigma regulatory factor/anti-sigma regulatory factor (Ser/Thr protein kinase)